MTGAPEASADPNPHAANPVALRAEEGPSGGAAAAVDAPLEGQLLNAPRKRWLTAALGLTGLLLIAAGVKLIGRYALGFRRPAQVRVSLDGVQLSYRVELLGKVLRNVEQRWPADGLLSISREVRFSRAGLYAGLAALSLGTFLGVGMILDGLRVPGLSPSLLGLGLLFVLAGLALDYAFSTFLDSSQGRCRIVVKPRAGSAWAVGGLGIEAADAALERAYPSIGEPALPAGQRSDESAPLTPDAAPSLPRIPTPPAPKSGQV